MRAGRSAAPSLSLSSPTKQEPFFWKKISPDPYPKISPCHHPDSSVMKKPRHLSPHFSALLSVFCFCERPSGLWDVFFSRQSASSVSHFAEVSGPKA
ncbi:hypothetical protein J437_LFUL013219 [Ladona fulva]|uniref:Uncharacterized protein n=1 Tax=Ladona fulva TaxID=123851 RepID=A0A8K0KH22_LADFU|nr:hypothetical protein J437_LFUL013219 [Ladona fulva]